MLAQVAHCKPGSCDYGFFIVRSIAGLCNYRVSPRHSTPVLNPKLCVHAAFHLGDERHYEFAIQAYSKNNNWVVSTPSPVCCCKCSLGICVGDMATSNSVAFRALNEDIAVMSPSWTACPKWPTIVIGAITRPCFVLPYQPRMPWPDGGPLGDNLRNFHKPGDLRCARSHRRPEAHPKIPAGGSDGARQRGKRCRQSSLTTTSHRLRGGHSKFLSKSNRCFCRFPFLFYSTPKQYRSDA